MNATQTIEEMLNRLLDEKKEAEKSLLNKSRMTSIDDTYDITISEQLEFDRVNSKIQVLLDLLIKMSKESGNERRI